MVYYVSVFEGIFSARSMQLTDIEVIAGISVLRGGHFRTLGFLTDRSPEMLVFLENFRSAAGLEQKEWITAVLTTPELAVHVPQGRGVGVCLAPRVTFANLHNHLARCGFYRKDFETSIDAGAQIHSTAFIAEKNVRIAGGTSVGPNASILERCVIEEGVTIGAGAVLGGVGFQTVRSSRPMIEMSHAGGLTIGAGAHILPGAVIATGLFGNDTRIAHEARIGARSFVSHGVRVGARTFVGHGAIINGNVVIGDDAWVGPGAIISNNLNIGDQAVISLGAVVIRDVPAGARCSGNFAIPHRRLLRKLAEMESSAPAE